LNKPDHLYILAWALHGRSHFFSDVDQIIEHAEQYGATRNLYMGVGLRAEILPPDRRGGNADIAAIGGLWIDVDVLHDAHKKQNLFPTVEDAYKFICDATELTPSYTIHSGHGLQAWWLFNEVWQFSEDDERQSAADLARKWTNTFRSKAQDIGYDVDATHDLSRVMRIPDTFNLKDKDNPVKVTVYDRYQVNGTIARYSPEDFEPFLLDLPGTERQQKAANGTSNEIIDVGTYKINSAAEPNFAKFDLLMDSSAKFKNSWLHKRKDMGDQSLSAYDQSLASLAARAGWSEQEIVDLMIAHRNTHGESGNHNNLEDYFNRTLRRAFLFAGVERRQALLVEELTNETDLEAKKEIMATLFSGVKITRLVKFTSDPPSYRLETDSGSVAIPSAADLMKYEKFSQHVADATKVVLPKIKDERWREILQSLFDVMEEQSAGEESTNKGMVRGWLSAYLTERTPTSDLEDIAHSSSPFVEDEEVYLFSASLRQWLYNTNGDRIDSKQLGTYLKAFGCNQVMKMLPTEKGGFTPRYCWHVPIENLTIGD